MQTDLTDLSTKSDQDQERHASHEAGPVSADSLRTRRARGATVQGAGGRGANGGGPLRLAAVLEFLESVSLSDIRAELDRRRRERLRQERRRRRAAHVTRKNGKRTP